MSKWMVPADKLDADQNQFIFEKSKEKQNYWIDGKAGSGKSILLVHTILDKIEENENISICIVVFTHSLVQMFTTGMQELKIPYKNVYLTTYHRFKNENYRYNYIFCDEVQDLPKSVLENMRSRCDRLIVAGDPNQSIYECDPQTKEPVVTSSEITQIIDAKPYPLEGIHRLTQSIINAVNKFLPTLFKAEQSKRRENTDIRLVKAEDREEEVRYILDKANKALEAEESVVIILPTHNLIAEFINIVLKQNNIAQWEKDNNLNRWGRPDYSKLHTYLKNNNINIEYIGNGYGDLYNASQNKILIMTYHSSKGLDFDNVFLAFANADSFYGSFTKDLFMVGMTRSKSELYISYTGILHSYVESFKDMCIEVDANNISNDNDDNDNDDFDF